MLVKRYSNRRLYDTEESRYITLLDLAEKIRGGIDVHVVDAKTNADLTQATLTQIVLESRGAAKFLPVPLLERLIRLGDDALSEFMGRYVSLALELYLQARRRVQAVSPYAPFATVPLDVASAFARHILGAGSWLEGVTGHSPANVAPPQQDEVAELRREVEALRQSIQKGKA